jgi:N-acetylneuraminic acid mutarotase
MWIKRGAVVGGCAAVVSLSTLFVLTLDLELDNGQARTSVAQNPSGLALEDWAPLPEAPIGPRVDEVSVSTGRGFIIWGGSQGRESLTDGAVYDVVQERWARLPRSPLDTPHGRTAVWTGTEMILWGGELGDGNHGRPDNGAAFDLSTNEWRRLAPSPYWSLAGHAAVWAGDQMLVWGGVSSDEVTGATYDPVSDKWQPLPAAPIQARHSHSAVWTGEQLIVWGGRSQIGTLLTDGASFDPASNTWTALPSSPLLPVTTPVAAWTGEEMIIVGGLTRRDPSRAGAAYDPVEARWREIAEAPESLWEMAVQPVSIGGDLIVVTQDGLFSYRPEADTWNDIESPVEAHRRGASAATAEDHLIIWGGVAEDAAEPVSTGWSARRGEH